MWKYQEIVFSREPDIDATIIKNNWHRLPAEHDWDGVDVVLVDQYLGSYRGSDLLRWVGENHPRIHRVMFTGDTTITTDQVDAAVVLHKPLGPAELVAAIRDGTG